MDNSSGDHCVSSSLTLSSSSSTSTSNATTGTAAIGSGLVAGDKGRLIKAINKQSDCWNHFHSYSNDPTIANCNHCGQDVSLGKSLSASKLTQHLRSRHRQIMVDEEAKKKRF